MDPVRIDLGLRVIATVEDYRRAGILMDDLHDAVHAVLHNEDAPNLNARFDFIRKASAMGQVAAIQMLPDGPESF